MTIQAQWNNEKFGVLQGVLKNLDSFEISCGISTEEKDSSNGVKKTIVKGIAAEELKISYSASFAVGTDPRQEFERLKKIASKGQADNFYLASKNVGNGKFIIQQVDLSDVKKDATGKFYSGKISVNLKQNISSSSKGSSTKKSGLSITQAEIDAMKARKQQGGLQK